MQPTLPSRREFLKQGSGVIIGALVFSSGPIALLAPSKVWALELSSLDEATGKSLLKFARHLYPHDTMEDAVYAMVVKARSTGSSPPDPPSKVPPATGARTSTTAPRRCMSSTILVPRSVFHAVGMYDSELPIEDYDFYLRLVLDFDVLFLDGPALAKYRVHDEKTTDWELGTGQIQTAEKHLALLDERGDIPDARVARRNFHLMIAQSSRVLGDRRRARAAALRALSLGEPRGLRLAR